MRKVVLHVESDRVLEPADIEPLMRQASALVPADTPQLLVMLSGRLPMWMVAALTHQYHPALAIATYDPRLGGGVVVASHTRQFQIGEVLDVTDAEKFNIVIEGGKS